VSGTKTLPCLGVLFVAIVDLFEGGEHTFFFREYHLRKRQVSESRWFKWKNIKAVNEGSKSWRMSV